MGGLFGGGSSKNAPFVLPGGLADDVTGGGLGQPFSASFGLSPFDVSSIGGSTTADTQSITNRYNQLGMGGSTPEQTDLAQAGVQSQALAGQEQQQDVSNPAMNPALQTPIAQVLGTQSPGSVGNLSSGNTQGLNTLETSLGNLATQAGLQSGLGGGGGLLGGLGGLLGGF
jgi:hypothetical protein